MPTTFLDAAETAAVRHVVERCASRPAGTDTVFDVLDDLQALVGCDLVAFNLHDTPERRLHHAQREVLRLVRLGMANKEVAQALGISPGTVRKHLEHTYARLGVQSRTEALRAATLDQQSPQATLTAPGRR